MNRVWRTMVLFLLLFSMSTFAHAAGVFQEGDMGQDVAQIQSQLNALGYAAGPADGDFGSSTAAAVKAFQKDRGLEPDGVVGTATFQALMGRDIPASRDSSTVSVRRVLQTALRYQGVPYVFGGTSPNGFDCSGFVRYVFAGNGFQLPRMADEQYGLGLPISYGRLQPGDLVFFSTYAAGVSHVGIYLGDSKFISATSSQGVAIARVDNSYWGPRYLGARRLL